MDATKTKVRENPREKANILSVIFWTWTLKIFRTGYSKVLGLDDLFDPLKTDRSGILGDRIEKEWFRELESKKKSKKTPSLLLTILRCFLWEYFFYGLLHIFNEFILRLGTPFLLGSVLRYFRESSGMTYNEALAYAAGLSITTGVSAVTVNKCIFGGYHIGGRIRVAVSSLVYRKALRLSTSAFGDTAPGKIVNLIAIDVNRFEMASVVIHHMWSAPLMAIFIAYFLYTEAGFAGMFGLLAILIVLPLQLYTGKLSSKLRTESSIKTDERVRLMDEIISGVQVIKMYAWEKPFCAMIASARKLELRVVRKFSWIRGLYMTLNLCTVRAALCGTLVGMMFFNEPITAEKAFVFYALFNVVSHTLQTICVRGITEIAECIVAARRLQNFLMYDEVGQLDLQQNFSKPTTPDKSCVELEENATKTISLSNHEDDRKVQGDSWSIKTTHVKAKWETSGLDNTLNDVNLKLERGKIYAVIGTVGAGKSSLLSAIIGELKLIKGSIDVRGELSYAAQDAWLFGSTVRQNIIFGQPYDQQRYRNVVKVCALLSDIQNLPQGDQTIVGERGKSLSGGQKARINLARAVYRQADIYILDDPLSAVDIHVGKHLFEECIQSYLSGKTRILVTHQIQHIKNVDGIILLENGCSRMFPNYIDLLTQCPEYAIFLKSDETQKNNPISNKNNLRGQWSRLSNRIGKPNSNEVDTSSEVNDIENVDTNHIEKSSKGVIHGSILIKYFKLGGNTCLIITVAFFFLISQLIASGTDFFVPIFINEEVSRINQVISENKNSSSGLTKNDLTPTALSYVYIYTGLISSLILVSVARSWIYFVLCIRNSQKLHDYSFAALIKTSMRFFDTNPSGRILNRFSKDMSNVDESLPRALLDATQIALLMTGAMIIVCTINPVFLIPLSVIGFIFYWIRKIYVKTSTNVKRLEGITRSPVFTHLNETINGLTTVRSCGAQNILKCEFDKFQDTHSSAWYIFIATSLAFGFSLELLSFIFITIITFTFILIDFEISGAEIGLAISTVMSMTGMMQWGMRQSAEATNHLTSVERILEYSLLPPEENIIENKPKTRDNNKSLDVTKPNIVSEHWPDEGCIKFHNVFLKYDENNPPVLIGLELVIKPREKVGIVGRTGAGKSSLISALFRLAKVEGVIDIDGMDISTIYLEDLRRKISIIPQDPVLFSGTLRKILDPFNEFNDCQLWEALEEVELKEFFTGSNGLESRVSDRGTNFSAGQRQLICLARAILRNNKILVLDEATANVDPHTDGLIQRTIRKKFVDCTVLTIAHRLNTIMDSDKVLVMDNGKVVEFDHPHNLLQTDSGYFASLVKESGKEMSEQLMRISKQAYDGQTSNKLSGN